MFVIDPAGKVDLRRRDRRQALGQSGRREDGANNYVRAALTEALAGKPVTTASTSPYGCSVKY